MALFRRERPARSRARIGRHALTASAERQTATSDAQRRSWTQKQERALAFYSKLGECWFPAQFYSRPLQRCRFFPAILDERGQPQEVEDGPLVDLWHRLRDPGSIGISQLVASYGRLQFLIGDGYLVVDDPGGVDEAWEYLSPLEVKQRSDGWQRQRSPGADWEPLAEDPWRLWRRHPTYSGWADSPVMGVLELYELLEWLTLAASAQATSRSAGRGLLYMPDELDFGGNTDDSPDEDPKADPFFEEFFELLSRPIKNPGTAEAAAPPVIRGPGVLETANGSHPMGDLIRHISFGAEERYAEAEMWEKVIDRIELSLDMPAGSIKSAGDLNHWSGWLLDEQSFRLYQAPTAERFCSDIAAAYLRPAAVEAGLPDADMVTVWYDPADAINHPDETKVARDAYLDGVVGPAYYLDAIGANEQDAPTDDEKDWLITVLSKGTQDSAEPQDGETAPQDGGTGNDTVEGQPQNGQPGEPALTAARIIGALEATVQRGRELAGSRIRTKAQGCQHCREQIDGIHPSDVASALGLEVVRDVINGHGAESSLVAGASTGLPAVLAAWGVDADVAVQLGQLCEQHALRNLYEPRQPPLPPGVHAVVAKAIR